MKAVTCSHPYQMAISQLERPRPGPGEVMVEVAATGICAGDMYIYTGKNPYVSYPVVAGHEIAGRVAETGEGVENIQLGTPVVVEPFIPCGGCYPCRAGKPNCCANLRIIGVHRPGGFAEYVSAPAENIYSVPEDMPLTLASLAEPITIAIHACQRGQVTAADTVLVMGCGPIGMNIIEVARLLGARVLACDINPARLEIAQLLGATPLLSDQTLASKVWELTNGEGMPVVIEAAGVPAVMEQAVQLVGAGGRVVIVGLVKKGVPVSLPGLDFTRKELTLLGSRTEAGNFPEAIRLLHSGRLHFPQMITPLDLWGAPETFTQLATQPDKYYKGIFVR